MDVQIFRRKSVEFSRTNLNFDRLFDICKNTPVLLLPNFPAEEKSRNQIFISLRRTILVLFFIIIGSRRENGATFWGINLISDRLSEITFN